MNFVENVIKNSLTYDEVEDKIEKFKRIVKGENERIKKGPSFPSSYDEEKDRTKTKGYNLRLMGPILDEVGDLCQRIDERLIQKHGA